MSTASSCIISTALLKPSTISPDRISGYSRYPPPLLRLPLNSRSRSLLLCLPSPTSNAEPIDTEAASNHPPIQPPAAPSSPPLPKAPSWMKWTVGSVVWLSLPTWRKVQSLQTVVEKVDTVVEVIEEVVETAENVASEVEKDLPEDSSLKKAALGLEHASEELLKNVIAIDSVIDKVEELGEKLKKDGKKAKAEKHVEKAVTK